MTKRKSDVSEWVNARNVAHIWSLILGRRIRPDSVHRVASRLGYAIHPVTSKYFLYLRSDIERIAPADFPARRKRKLAS